MIKLIKSTFYNEKKSKQELIKFIREAKQLSIGEECVKFENKFAKWQGAKYSVLFNSGSSANLALIQSLLNLGLLKKGMNVGFSGITWATNVMPLMQLGLNPIPIDVEIDTLNVSVEKLRAVHSKYALDALFLTNLLGFADNLPTIKSFCKTNSILLLEDNCESLGSEIRHKKLGNYGMASTFSFFVGHHMSAIEGGAVVTNNSKLAKMLKMVRSHGWDRHLTALDQKQLRRQHKISDFESKYIFYDLAYNLRPTEITGFLGNNQLQFITETINKREKNFFKFQTILEGEQFYNLNLVHMNLISNFAMPIVCKSAEIKQKAIEISQQMGIEIRPIVGGVMADQPFFKKYISQQFDLSNSRLIHMNGFYFGNNPELSSREITLMIDTYKNL